MKLAVPADSNRATESKHRATRRRPSRGKGVSVYACRRDTRHSACASRAPEFARTLPFRRPCRTSGPPVPPQGSVTMDFAIARRMMVDGQIRPADVTDPYLLTAMLEIPRERFVP